MKIYADKSGNQFIWNDALGQMVPYQSQQITSTQAYRDKDGNLLKWDPSLKEMVPYDDSLPVRNRTKEVVDKMSWGEQALVNAGREFVKLGRGVKEWFANDEEKARLQQENESEDRAFEPMKEHGSTSASIVGSTLPYLAPLPGGMAAKAVTKAVPALKATVAGKPLLTSLIPKATLPTYATRGAKAANTAKKAVTNPLTKTIVGGAAVGAAHQDSSTAEGASLGALGYGIGNLIAKPLSRVPTKLTKAQKEIVEWAKKKGYELPPGVKTGNISLQEIDQALRTNTHTGALLQKYDDQIKRLSNQIASEKLGIEGIDSLDPASLASAREIIGKRFNRLASGTTGYLRKNQIEKMYGVVKELERRPGMESLAKQIKNEIRTFQKGTKFVEGVKGSRKIPGNLYQKTTKSWRDSISAGYKHGATEKTQARGKALKQIQKIIDDAMDVGQISNKKPTSDWRKVRAQYRFLNDIEDAMTNEGASGNINIKELYRNYMRKDRKRMLEGKMYDKDMEMLAKLGNLLATQRGASLGASQGITNLFKSDSPASNALSLLAKQSRLPIADDLALRLYMGGYPTVTGLLGLPGYTPQLFGDIAARAAMSQQSN